MTLTNQQISQMVMDGDCPSCYDKDAEIKRLEAIEQAAVVVIAGLRDRIIKAPEDAVPVFEGIVQLHDALGGRGTSVGDRGKDNAS